MANSFLMGVNLAGAEFAPQHVPGVFGTDYTYPTHTEIDYYASKGLDVIRLPFLWERLQRTELGPLDACGAWPTRRRRELCNQQGSQDRNRATQLRLRFRFIDRKWRNTQLILCRSVGQARCAL